MTRTVIHTTQLAALGLVAALTWGCEAKKSENPLSPNVAGPIAGVAITVPAPLSPVHGTEVLNNTPLRLTFANSSTNGVRPLWYIVELASDSSFNSKLYTNGKVLPAEGAHTSLVLEVQLGAEATYFWRVRADDGANSTEFSAAAHFDLVVPVALGAPTLASPADGATTGSRTPTLTINNGTVTGRAGTVEYRFDVATDQAFSNIAATMTAARGAGTTSVTTPELAAGTLFYWRARATNGTVSSPVSGTGTFRTPAAPAPPAPTPPGPNPGPVPGPGAPPPVGNTITDELRVYVLNRIEWLREQYPQAWYYAHRHIDINGNPTGVSYDEALRFARIVAFDLYTHVSPRFGLNGKRGDPTQLSMDVFSFMRSSNVRDVIIIDYIVNAGIDSAHVAWGDVTEVSAPYGGGIWVQPHRPSEYRH
jgi:hypothetical protein